MLAVRPCGNINPSEAKNKNKKPAQHQQLSDDPRFAHCDAIIGTVCRQRKTGFSKIYVLVVQGPTVNSG
jgi:hypothetical protein